MIDAFSQIIGIGTYGRSSTREGASSEVLPTTTSMPALFNLSEPTSGTSQPRVLGSNFVRLLDVRRSPLTRFTNY